MGVEVWQQSGPLGDVVTLPASPGPTTVKKKVKVPREAPSGSYELTVRATDQNDADVTCLRIPFAVG